nr:hypothetical protein [Tanacetum cinerariifolium]
MKTTEEESSSNQVNEAYWKKFNIWYRKLRTLLNVPRKTKHGINARLDLAELGIKPELFARQEGDKTTLPPAGYTLMNVEKTSFVKRYPTSGNRPEGCIAEETIVEETIEFFSEYHKTLKTIGIPPDKHVINENEDEKPMSAGKSNEVSGRHKQVLKTKNPSKRIALLENEHCNSFAKWLREEVERELAIYKDSVSETVRWISYGPRATIVKYEAYNINGEIHLFKCDWVNHKADGVKHDPNLDYTLVDLNSLGHKDDVFILASQARQVFYVKDQIDKKLSIVIRTPTKNYKDTYDEVNEEFSTVVHEHNDNILPRVNRHDLGNESQNDYYRTDCEEPI